MTLIDDNQPNLHKKSYITHYPDGYCPPCNGAHNYKNLTLDTPLENRTMGDDETLIQLVKIVLGVIGLIILASGIFHLNKNLTTIIKQNGEMIEILRKSNEIP